jgi:hypothetical protein
MFPPRHILAIVADIIVYSWSPDGAFIAASNAMNGPIFVAQVIERHAWNSDISFVGHENTVEVAVSDSSDVDYASNRTDVIS